MCARHTHSAVSPKVLTKRRISQSVVTLITQTLVDQHDKAFANPSKPVGHFYTEDEAKELRNQG